MCKHPRFGLGAGLTLDVGHLRYLQVLHLSVMMARRQTSANTLHGRRKQYFTLSSGRHCVMQIQASIDYGSRYVYAFELYWFWLGRTNRIAVKMQPGLLNTFMQWLAVLRWDDTANVPSCKVRAVKPIVCYLLTCARSFYSSGKLFS